jgi:tetratricopeptide (TPR) repeat protein
MNGLFSEMAALPVQHDDLLPLARRLWRRPLGGARLADVESGVLGVRRYSDCAGSEVPERYFRYLRGGSPELLAEVLDHNLQDIVSLALLEAEVVRLRAGAWRTAGVLDRRGMAIDLLRDGEHDAALELLEDAVLVCADPAEGIALRRLATRLLLAAGEVERAEGLWRTSTRRASLDAVLSWIEVARIRERHRGDLRGALEATEAASRVLDLTFALGRGGGMLTIGKARLQVDARLRRLRRWVAAAERRAARAAGAERQIA